MYASRCHSFTENDALAPGRPNRKHSFFGSLQHHLSWHGFLADGCRTSDKLRWFGDEVRTADWHYFTRPKAIALSRHKYPCSPIPCIKFFPKIEGARRHKSKSTGYPSFPIPFLWGEANPQEVRKGNGLPGHFPLSFVGKNKGTQLRREPPSIRNLRCESAWLVQSHGF